MSQRDFCRTPGLVLGYATDELYKLLLIQGMFYPNASFLSQIKKLPWGGSLGFAAMEIISPNHNEDLRWN